MRAAVLRVDIGAPRLRPPPHASPSSSGNPWSAPPHHAARRPSDAPSFWMTATAATISICWRRASRATRCRFTPTCRWATTCTCSSVPTNDSGRYLLTAYRYIDLNPVRAARVEKPEHHHRSSVHANRAPCDDSLITPHACFIEMGDTRRMRAAACRAWLEQGVSDDALIAVRQHLQQERAFGSKRFQAITEKTLGRPVSVRRPGPPARTEAERDGI